jgi:hypothetical protein
MSEATGTPGTAGRRVSLFCIALASLAANFTIVTGAWAKSCALKLVGSTDISTPRDWAVLMHVTVNGHPAAMELDMASIASLIREEYVQPFGLRLRPAPVHMNWRSESQSVEMSRFARLSALEIGSAKLGNPPVWVLPEGASTGVTELGTQGSPNVGRLGVDVLGALDFELDFANNKLSFYSTDHCPGAGVYWTRNYASTVMTRAPLGNLIFPVELDGKKVEAVISTAMAQSWMFTDATHRLYGFDETSDGVEVRTGGMGSPTYYRRMTLSGFGSGGKNVPIRLDRRSVDRDCSLTTRNTGAAYYLGEPCKGSEAPLYLGMDVLRHLHLYFATKEQVLYFSDAGQ